MDLSKFWVVIDNYEEKARELHTELLNRRLLSSYCSRAEGGKSVSSSFSGCTSDTLFILAKI